MMEALNVVKSLNLPDWWLAAGFVRNKVWDSLHEYPKRTEGAAIDVDVVYFDPQILSAEAEKEIELNLFLAKPGVPWSVTNQARMWEENGDAPYLNSIDAITRWPETATCVGVKLNDQNKLELAAPLGLDDVIRMILRPNKLCRRNTSVFYDRLHKKNWLRKWPRVKVAYE